MYTIIKGKDGKFHCMFRLQDGTERYTEESLEAAVAHAKRFAKSMNGHKIKRKNIEFLEEQDVTGTKYVPMEIPGKKGKK